jgi:hypothetical protein
MQTLPLPLGLTNITLLPHPAPTLPTNLLPLWHALLATNPRLFPGPILSVHSFNPATGHLTLARDTFDRLLIQQHHPHTNLNIQLLGVKALITALDHAQNQHILIQRRHHQTRIYPNQWEIGPAGSLEPPTPSPAPITHLTLFQTLIDEITSELGLPSETLTALANSLPTRQPAFVLTDPIAHSLDFCYPLNLPNPIDPRRSPCSDCATDWEVTETVWLARTDAEAFLSRAEKHNHAAPTMRPMLHALGWLS